MAYSLSVSTGTNLLDQVLGTIRRHGMLAGGETVLVGVSGGADSVFLLYCLLTLAPTLGLRLYVVHVNHGLRSDAAADQAFVEELARQWGAPASVERVSIPVGRGQSPEAAARAARYVAFRRAAERVGASRTALGHTADDQAETVLMRLLQGAGPRGIAGIPPVRGPYIRPLLEVRRHQIEAELRRLGVAWREDPTNRDPKFLRNRIRHDLLPFLSASVHPRIAEALCRTGELTRAVITELDALALRELDRLAVIRSREILLSLKELQKLPAGVGEEVLRQALSQLGEEGPFRAWAQHTLRHLLEGEGPAGPYRVGRILLERSMAQLRLSSGSPVRLPERSLSVHGALAFPEVGVLIEAQAFDRPAGYQPPTGLWRVAFDRDQLTGPLSVRSRRPGDSFHPFGAPGSKPLKAFLIDAKLPRWERGRLPLVVAGGEIVWVVGLRRGVAAPVTPVTCRLLELRAISLGEDRATE